MSTLLTCEDLPGETLQVHDPHKGPVTGLGLIQPQLVPPSSPSGSPLLTVQQMLGSRGAPGSGAGWSLGPARLPRCLPACPGVCPGGSAAAHLSRLPAVFTRTLPMGVSLSNAPASLP